MKYEDLIELKKLVDDELNLIKDGKVNHDTYEFDKYAKALINKDFYEKNKYQGYAIDIIVNTIENFIDEIVQTDDYLINYVSYSYRLDDYITYYAEYRDLLESYVATQNISYGLDIDSDIENMISDGYFDRDISDFNNHNSNSFNFSTGFSDFQIRKNINLIFEELDYTDLMCNDVEKLVDFIKDFESEYDLKLDVDIEKLLNVKNDEFVK